MAFYILGPKLLFETTEISTQQESYYIYLYTTKFGTSIKIRLNRKFELTEFETVRVTCIKIKTSTVNCLQFLCKKSLFKVLMDMTTKKKMSLVWRTNPTNNEMVSELKTSQRYETSTKNDADQI